MRHGRILRETERENGVMVFDIGSHIDGSTRDGEPLVREDVHFGTSPPSMR